MKVLKRIFKFSLVGIFSVLSIFVTGCGTGGGGGDDTPQTVLVEEGIFIDSRVQGLTYETASQSGTTDVNGTFAYQNGETVSFFIGSTVFLGHGTAKEKMNPIDLVPGAIGVKDATVTNICRFLQSLDVDGVPNNGITITQAIADEVDGRPIDFKQNIEDFGNDYDIQALFDTLNDIGAFTNGYEGALRSAEEAQRHLRDTLLGCTEDGCYVFGIYSETACYGVRLDVNAFLGLDGGKPNPDSEFIDDPNEKQEGLFSKRFTVNVDPTDDWEFWFVQHGLTSSDSETTDMSEFREGFLKFFVKSPIDLLVGIRSGNVQAGEETSRVCLSGFSSFEADNEWHAVSIPLSEFEGPSPKADLAQIKTFFVIGSTSELSGGTDEDVTFWVDDVRWVRCHDNEEEEDEYNEDCDIGGGICPTFIQLPSHVKYRDLRTTRMDISRRKLFGKITVPVEDSLLRSDIPIYGVAGGNDFEMYQVEYGKGRNPTEWHLIEFSKIPQIKTDVGIAEMSLMQGDLNLRGNLATWNVGLKNWVHLPWHPPEDLTDLNGIYTLRLVVFGKNDEKVEDRFTIEVGRVIAQALPGIVISPDGRVVMRFPEQSLTAPFRVYTILPLEETEEPPPIPNGRKLISPIYRVREPGDRFIKEVTLEFAASRKDLVGYTADHAAIGHYDIRNKEWRRLPTVHLQKHDDITFITPLAELAIPKAIYALILYPDHVDGSRPIDKKRPKSKGLQPVRPGVLVHNTFEENSGSWQSRDHFVGAMLTRDDKATSASSFALKLTNQSQRGNFSVTILEHPFDVKKYPMMSFDYRISHDVKIDFYLLVNNRWYNLGFTDDIFNFRNKDTNMANIGLIEDVVTDNRWHSASVNLYKLLRQKTRHTQIDAIVMADWDVTEYMKLQFGHNKKGAVFHIDNFKLFADSTDKLPDIMMVEDFNATKSVNLLGGPKGKFSNQEIDCCQTEVAKSENSVDSDPNLKVMFDTSKDNAYCGYWTALMASSLEEMSEISFRLHTPKRIPPILVGIRHAMTGFEAKVPLSPYVNSSNKNGWRTISIPLSAFLGRGLPDLISMDTLSFTFERNISSGKGTILLDDILFRREANFARVADFNHYPLKYNLLGGGFRTVEEGAAAISAGYHEEKASPSHPVKGALRISYGGLIGLDYGDGRFSYAIWETDLLGFDARQYDSLAVKIRGQRGGEKPNIYLDDGVVRRCMRANEFRTLTTSWQTIRLPLGKFASDGIDLSHLEALQIDFEWEEMNGTIYVAEIQFEQNSDGNMLVSQVQTMHDNIDQKRNSQ